MMRAGSASSSAETEGGTASVFSTGGGDFYNTHTRKSGDLIVLEQGCRSQGFLMFLVCLGVSLYLQVFESVCECVYLQVCVCGRAGETVTSSLATGGMMGGLGLRSVRYMALESRSREGGTFSFRCRSSHYTHTQIVCETERSVCLRVRTCVREREVGVCVCLRVRTCVRERESERET